MTITGKAKVAGVMGWPVGHSRSPLLHNFWLAQLGIDGAYVPFAVRPESLEAALRALPALGLAGVNLTVPHKEAAVALMDTLDAPAKRIGAVNTIVVANGRLEGRNTDGYGFVENLRAGAKGWRGANGPAVVIGAGGAARAIAVALIDEGVPEIRVVNRTAARAAALTAEFGKPLVAVTWERRATALDGAALLVNATTLGMTGQPALALPLDALPKAAVVTDAVYAPLETALLAAARGRGNVCVDGLGMLLHQARPAFAAWFGHDPEVTPELRAHVLATG